METNELVAWSEDDSRPLWQRDALRRIVKQGEVTGPDIDQLKKMIENEVGLINEEAPNIERLLETHIKSIKKDQPKTVLASIGSVRNVDRLASNQPPIIFANNGITLIYGENGSGKSGYCRIVKTLCNSMPAERLRSNVYEEDFKNSIEVDYSFVVEGNPLTKRTWKFDDSPPIELNQISVFDTERARIYIDKNRKVRYSPFELDVLSKLYIAAKTLQEKFEGDENKIDYEISSRKLSDYNKGTTAHSIISKIVNFKESTKLPSETDVRNVANWTTENEKELQMVTSEINNSPIEQIKLSNSIVETLKRIIVDVTKYLEKIDDKSIKQIIDLHSLMHSKQKMAQDLANVEVSKLDFDMPLKKIGSEVWRQMVKYALEFSFEISPDKREPILVSSEICALCQQTLSKDATKRLKFFEEYINGRTAKESTEATKRYEDYTNSIISLSLPNIDQITDTCASIDSINDKYREYSKKILELFNSISLRLKSVKAAINEKNFEQLKNTTPLKVEIIGEIESEIETIQKSVSELNKIVTDKGRIRKLSQKKLELEDKKLLNSELELILSILNFYKHKFKIRAGS